MLFIIGVIQISQYSSLDGVAIGKVKVITYISNLYFPVCLRQVVMRKNSQADRAQDNSDSYIRERLRLPRGDQGEITFRKVKKKNLKSIFLHERASKTAPRRPKIRILFILLCWLPSLNLKTCSGKTKLSLKVSICFYCQHYNF